MLKPIKHEYIDDTKVQHDMRKDPCREIHRKREIRISPPAFICHAGTTWTCRATFVTVLEIPFNTNSMRLRHHHGRQPAKNIGIMPDSYADRPAASCTSRPPDAPDTMFRRNMLRVFSLGSVGALVLEMDGERVPISVVRSCLPGRRALHTRGLFKGHGEGKPAPEESRFDKTGSVRQPPDGAPRLEVRVADGFIDQQDAPGFQCPE